MLHHRGRPLLLSVSVALGLVTMLGLSSCSSDGSDGATPTTKTGGDVSEPGGDDTDSAAGGGSARVTIGEDTWEFAPVVCGFGEEETGVEGAVFNLSAGKDKINLYAAAEPGRNYFELSDLGALGDDDGLSWMTADEPDFEVDGRNLSGTFDVVSTGSDSIQVTESAEFEAVCP